MTSHIWNQGATGPLRLEEEDEADVRGRTFRLVDSVGRRERMAFDELVFDVNVIRGSDGRPVIGGAVRALRPGQAMVLQGCQLSTREHVFTTGPRRVVLPADDCEVIVRRED